MASGLLDSGNVRYYHPADNLTENTSGLIWSDDNGDIEFAPSILTSGIRSNVSNVDAKFKFVTASGEYNDVQATSGFTCAVWISGFLTGDNLTSFFFAGFSDAVSADANVAYIEKGSSATDFNIATIINGTFKSRPWTPAPPNDDGFHFFVVDIRFETSGWRHRVSLDGDDWVDLGVNDIASTPNVNTQTLIQSRSRTSGPRNIVDEIVFWADNALFTDQELSNLYQLFNNFDTTMEQYGIIFDVNAVRDVDLFISGKTQSSGNISLNIPGQFEIKSIDLFTSGSVIQSGTLTANATLFLTGHEISNNNLNLTIKSNGASGMLDPENVIFYHPLDDNIEHTLNETWEGTGVFVEGVIGSGVSAVTPSAMFFGDFSGAFDVGTNSNVSESDFLDTDKIIITTNVFVSPSFQQRGVVASFDGFDVTYGSEVFVRTGNRTTDVVALSQSSVVFVSQGESFGGKATAATVSGVEITLGSESTFSSSIGSSITAFKIDSTRFVIVFQDSTNSAVTSMVIGEVSGTTITYGTTFVLTGSAVVNQRGIFEMINTSQFLVTYSVGSSGLFSAIGSLSGTTITSVASGTQVPTTGDDTKLTAGLDVALIDSSGTKFIVVAPFDTGSESNDEGRAVIGSISGTNITFGSDITFNTAINVAARVSVTTLDSDKFTGVIGFIRGASSPFKNTPHTLLFNSSGTTITNTTTPARFADFETNNIDLVTLDDTRISMIQSQGITTSVPPLLTYVGQLFEFISLSSNNPNYPKLIGNKNIATFFWSKNPTKNRAQVRLERGYNITFTSGSIELGGTTAIWNSSGIQSLMDILNDNGEHSLATYFIHQSGTTWKLLTSIDGESFIDRGVQNVGSQGLLTTNTDAEVFLFDPDDEDQWLDEAVLWAGEPEQFNEFNDLELFKLNRLATILDQPMPSFSTAAFPVSASGDLVIPTTFNVSQSSETLFIKGHTPIESSVALVAQGPVPVSGGNALVLQGPAGRGMDLVTKGPIPESGNTTLFTKGPLPLQSSGTLFVEGVQIPNANIDLVIPAVDDILQSSGILFIEGGGLIQNNITLITKGPSAITESGLSLFIEGVSVEAEFDKIVDIFLRTADFNPTVIGLFTSSASGVTIEVFDVIDGVNTQLTLLDDICFAIGDTGRFGWSTENLPDVNRNAGQFVFRMTDSIGETFVGEFFLTNPGDGLSNHPDDFDDYILKG